MKVLLDNNVPAYLLDLFKSHLTTTAFREGWHRLSNGSLLAAADAHRFDVLVTLDIGFLHQQNMAGRQLRVAVLRPLSQDRASVIATCERLWHTLEEIVPGEVVSIQERR